VAISYFVPIEYGGSVIGVIFRAKDGSSLIEIAEKLSFGNDGQAFIINDKGVNVANKDISLVLAKANPIEQASENPEMQSLADYEKKVIQGKNGLGTFEHDGKIVEAAFAPIEGTNWFLTVAQPRREILSGLNVLKNSSVIIALALLAIGVIIGTILIRLITKPIIKVANHLTIVSDGDFSQEVDPSLVNRRDEIGTLAKAANLLSVNLRGLIWQVSQAAEQVAASAEELTANAEQQAFITNEVAKAIQGVVEGTEKQSDALTETSSVIEQMSASMQEVSASSTEVANKSDSTSKAANEGQSVVETSVQQMDRIGNVTRDVQTAIHELAVGSKRIGEITDVISSIAAQTNLLALNAAIEAARAGEHGKGFAVVADEVRKLAEQSAEATHQINELINENQKNIDKAVEAMQANVKDVDAGIGFVKTAGQTFEEIAASINNVVGHIQGVTAAIEEMATGSQRMVDSVRLIDAISKDSLDKSQTVSGATKDLAASAEQIASASQNLSAMAQELQISVGKFKI
jgi:methyl-accepting chemotaxis protein